MSKYFSNPAIVVAVVVVVALGSMTWAYIPTWKNSETLWLRVLKRHPNYLTGRHDLASFQQRLGKHAEAVDNYEKALALRPWNEEIGVMQPIQGHWGLAYSLAALGKMEEAERHFQESLRLYKKTEAEIGPGRKLSLPDGYYEHLVQHMQKHRALKALKLNPNDATAHAALAKILSRQGQAKEADFHFRRAAELGAPFCALNYCQ